MLKYKDLLCLMESAAGEIQSAMDTYGYLKEQLYQYSDIDPNSDEMKISALNSNMERLISAFEGYELAVDHICRKLLDTVAYARGEEQ